MFGRTKKEVRIHQKYQLGIWRVECDQGRIPDVCLLLSSGYSVDGQANEILDQGCNGFIQKPFSIQELSRKIRDILNQ